MVFSRQKGLTAQGRAELPPPQGVTEGPGTMRTGELPTLHTLGCFCAGQSHELQGDVIGATTQTQCRPLKVILIFSISLGHNTVFDLLSQPEWGSFKDLCLVQTVVDDQGIILFITAFQAST